jgi:predicted transcriptional regulator
MKKEFLDYLQKLREASPNIVASEAVEQYIAILMDTSNDKPELTDNGKLILKFLQDHPVAPWKSKEIAEGLFISSRAVSGAMRKLVNDGFVEKLGKEPVIYTITEKGKNYQIEGQGE